MSWQPIETAPRMRIILLWAVTDISDAGEIKNWKMATGHYSDGDEGWEWDGRVLQPYDVQPTHWQPLPDPPAAEKEEA